MLSWERKGELKGSAIREGPSPLLPSQDHPRPPLTAHPPVAAWAQAPPPGLDQQDGLRPAPGPATSSRLFGLALGGGLADAPTTRASGRSVPAPSRRRPNPRPNSGRGTVPALVSPLTAAPALRLRGSESESARSSSTAAGVRVSPLLQYCRGRVRVSPSLRLLQSRSRYRDRHGDCRVRHGVSPLLQCCRVRVGPLVRHCGCWVRVSPLLSNDWSESARWSDPALPGPSQPAGPALTGRVRVSPLLQYRDCWV